MANMTSHELARRMAATADYLLSRPDFDTPCTDHSLYLGSYWDDKDAFIAAVKALGSGTKEYSGSDLQYNAATPMRIWTRINRNKVCRKVQEERWECESILSAEDEVALEDLDQQDAPEHVIDFHAETVQELVERVQEEPLL